MTTTRATAAPILRPDEVRPLLLEPIERDSIAAQCSTVVYIDAPALHVPAMTDLDVADWRPEGEEIPLGDVSFTGQTITPARLVGGSILTQELAEDSSPEAAQLIGAALARDLRRALDSSFFGSKGSNAEQPAGLADLTGTTNVAPATSGDVLGAFLTAEQAAAGADAALDVYVTHPTTAAAIGKALLTAGSAADYTAPTERRILGVPVIATPLVPAGTVYGFDKSSTLLVFRVDAEIERDDSIYFTSYRIAIRGRIRVSWGFTRPDSVIKIAL